MEYASFNNDVREAIEWRRNNGGTIFLSDKGEAIWFRLGITPSEIMRHKAAGSGRLYIADNPPLPDAPEGSKTYKVIIDYTATINYQAEVDVVATSHKVAAEKAKELNSFGGLPWSEQGESRGPYGFEVSTEGEPTESWQEDE